MRIYLQCGTNDGAYSRSSNNTKRDKSHCSTACPRCEDVPESGGYVTDRRRCEYATKKSSHKQTGDVIACCASDAEEAVDEDGGEHGPFAAVGFAYGGPDHGSEGPAWI